MISAVAFFLLFILPFIIVPFGITQFETPKVVLAEGGIILLFVLSLIENKYTFLQNKLQVLLYSGIAGILLINALFLRTNISFFGNPFRMQGIFLLTLLLLFSLLTSHVKIPKVPWWLFGFLILIEFVWTIFLPLNGSQRYVGTLGEPNASAAFMLFLWPFAWLSSVIPARAGIQSKYESALGLGDRRKSVLSTLDSRFHGNDKRHSLGSNFSSLMTLFFFLLSLFILIAIFYLTKSKSAMIGFAIQILFLVLLQLKVSIKKSLMVCFLLFIVSLGFTPFFEKDVVYENRGDVWTAGYYAGLANPILGAGFGNTELQIHKAAIKYNLRIKGYYVDSSHNIFLDWWVQGGIIGLLLLCSLVFVSFKNFVRNKNVLYIVLFLGLVVAVSFNPASIVELLGFWWLVGKGFETTAL